MSCNAESLTKVNLFELLNDDDRAAISEVIDLIKVQANDVLFNAGDVGDSLFIVLSGEIELFIKDTAGQKIVLAMAKCGDLFGELAMLEESSRTATAVALNDSELFALDRDDLLLVFQTNPATALKMLAALSKMTRKADELLRTRVSRNVNEETDEKFSTLQKIADLIAWFSGSMQFLVLNAVLFFIWIAVNTLTPENWRFDPYPFGFLTMVVSLEAIFLSCFVLISQNRQAEKDRVRSDIEYEVNIKAELEVAHLHEKADRIYEQMQNRFAKLEKSLSAQNNHRAINSQIEN